jgi:hypothetical protein
MIKYLLQIMANIFTDDTKLLSENMNTINNNTEILLQVKKWIGLEINTHKIHTSNVTKPSLQKSLCA